MFEFFNERDHGSSSPLVGTSPLVADYGQQESARRDGHSALLPQTDASIEHALGYILTDCFFSLGQGVADRKPIDHSAVIWIHDHYRRQFFRTIKANGNTWLRDRHRVAGVSRMLGERAAHYATEKPSIDLASVLHASADVKRYCTLHTRRRRRSMGMPTQDQPLPRLAGSWCEIEPEQPPSDRK